MGEISGSFKKDEGSTKFHLMKVERVGRLQRFKITAENKIVGFLYVGVNAEVPDRVILTHVEEK